MASFELVSSHNDGHIRALTKAVTMASRISKEIILEFTPEKMRLCARTDIFLVKFVFYKDFFSNYNCLTRRRCYMNVKSLMMPFKSSILFADHNEGNLRSLIIIKCFVDDQVNNQIIIKIGAESPSATLTYRLTINDLDQEKMAELNAINRTIDFARVEISPKQQKREKFLLSGFSNFAPDIDQVTIKVNQTEVKFIGSICPLLSTNNTTTEFSHKKEDFSTYAVKEDVNITIQLRYLKLFLSFVETNKVQTFPKYIFEGIGMPAHFIYDAQLFKGHFICSTECEYIPPDLDSDMILAIENGADESFYVMDDIKEETFEYNNAEDEAYAAYNEEDNYNDNDNNEDGYNDNNSDCSDLLDGNLEGLDTNKSLWGGESIRSEMREVVIDPEKAKEILNLDQDPDEVENMVINYSDDEEDSIE